MALDIGWAVMAEGLEGYVYSINFFISVRMTNLNNHDNNHKDDPHITIFGRDNSNNFNDDMNNESSRIKIDNNVDKDNDGYENPFCTSD